MGVEEIYMGHHLWGQRNKWTNYTLPSGCPSITSHLPQALTQLCSLPLAAIQKRAIHLWVGALALSFSR